MSKFFQFEHEHPLKETWNICDTLLQNMPEPMEESLCDAAVQTLVTRCFTDLFKPGLENTLCPRRLKLSFKLMLKELRRGFSKIVVKKAEPGKSKQVPVPVPLDTDQRKAYHYGSETYIVKLGEVEPIGLSIAHHAAKSCGYNVSALKMQNKIRLCFEAGFFILFWRIFANEIGEIVQDVQESILNMDDYVRFCVFDPPELRSLLRFLVCMKVSVQLFGTTRNKGQLMELIPRLAEEFPELGKRYVTGGGHTQETWAREFIYSIESGVMPAVRPSRKRTREAELELMARGELTTKELRMAHLIQGTTAHLMHQVDADRNSRRNPFAPAGLVPPLVPSGPAMSHAIFSAHASDGVMWDRSGLGMGMGMGMGDSAPFVIWPLPSPDVTHQYHSPESMHESVYSMYLPEGSYAPPDSFIQPRHFTLGPGPGLFFDPSLSWSLPEGAKPLPTQPHFNSNADSVSGVGAVPFPSYSPTGGIAINSNGVDAGDPTNATTSSSTSTSTTSTIEGLTGALSTLTRGLEAMADNDPSSTNSSSTSKNDTAAAGTGAGAALLGFWQSMGDWKTPKPLDEWKTPSIMTRCVTPHNNSSVTRAKAERAAGRAERAERDREKEFEAEGRVQRGEAFVPWVMPRAELGTSALGTNSDSVTTHTIQGLHRSVTQLLPKAPAPAQDIQPFLDPHSHEIQPLYLPTLPMDPRPPLFVPLALGTKNVRAISKGLKAFDPAPRVTAAIPAPNPAPAPAPTPTPTPTPTPRRQSQIQLPSQAMYLDRSGGGGGLRVANGIWSSSDDWKQNLPLPAALAPAPAPSL